MDNAAVVEIVQGSERVGQGGLEGPQVHLSSGESFGQRPLHQFHHQPPLLAIDVIDGDDIGVLQRGEELGFLPVPVHLQCAAGEFIAKLLDGNFTIEFAVTGPVDGGVTSRSDGFEQFVTGFAGHRVSPLTCFPPGGRVV